MKHFLSSKLNICFYHVFQWLYCVGFVFQWLYCVGFVSVTVKYFLFSALVFSCSVAKRKKFFAVSKKAKIVDGCVCLKRGGRWEGGGWKLTRKDVQTHKKIIHIHTHVFYVSFSLFEDLQSSKHALFRPRGAFPCESVEGISLEQSKHTETKNRRWCGSSLKRRKPLTKHQPSIHLKYNANTICRKRLNW